MSRTKTAIIGVKDNGIGIPVAMKKTIFEKAVGKNTVFGLFLLRSILSITCLDIDETGIEGEDAKFIITISYGGWRSGVQKTCNQTLNLRFNPPVNIYRFWFSELSNT